MASTFLTAAMWVHITAGAIASLIVFPILILGTKGPGHRRLGRWAVGLTWVIALAGLTMLVNPLFLAFWNSSTASLSDAQHDYVTYFAGMAYEPLFFLYLDVILLYLVLTGVGVWARLRGRRPDGSVPPRRVDVVLAIVMAVFALAQFALGVADLDTDSGYADSAISVATIMLTLVLWDVWTWRDGGRRVRQWWVLHATKLIVAWGGLFYAVLLRQRVQDEVLESVESWVVLAWVLAASSAMLVFGLLQHRRRLARRAASHAAASA